MAVFRFLVAVMAILMIVAGAATAISPIPFGLPLLVIGFLLLASASPLWVKWLRRRWGWFDSRLRWLQKRLPRWMTGSLRRTDPRKDDDDEDEDDDDDDDDD